MSVENSINEILENLVESGSQINYLKELKERSLKLSTKDIDLDEALSGIAKEIKEQTEMFLNQKNEVGINYISGISTCIYLSNFDKCGEYKLKIMGGKALRTKSAKINDGTLFDIDSITELYTLILLFKLEKERLIDLNAKISDINPDFQNLGDFTLNDFIRLNVDLKTKGDISKAQTEEEAYDILKTIYMFSDKNIENNYSDFCSIIISDTIEKVISKIKGEKIAFEDIMLEYLLNPLQLYQTQFNPSQYNLSGNGNKKRLVYDEKARILGGIIGHAGLFATSEDLARLSKKLYSVNYFNKNLISKVNLSRLSEINFNNSSKYKMTPLEFSKGSFSNYSSTGSYTVFDPNNLIHNNILVNALYKDEERQTLELTIGFDVAFSEYQKQITKNIMLMYVVKEYYNRYLGVKENIEVTKYI